MGQRLKGQDTGFSVISDTQGLETSLGLVMSAELTPQFDILTQGYLGETSDRRDDIFKGIAGRLEVHMDRRDALLFINAIKERAQRRVPGNTRFQIQGIFNFDDGTRLRFTVDDAFFGEQQFTIGGREEYVTYRIAFEAQDFRLVAA